MFALKRIFSLNGASPILKCIPKTEKVDMIWTLTTNQKPLLNYISQLDSSVRYKSRGKKKEEESKLLNLSHIIYAKGLQKDDTIPIIIMHGLLGSKNNWNSMAKAIHIKTNSRMVVAVDARNHGDSPHTDEFSYEIMVSDLIKLMNDLQISKATLIGHSLGGRVCMLLAMMYPKMVHSLVVVDISPLGESPGMLELPKLFKTIQTLDLHPHLILNEARKRATAQLKEKIKDEKLISFLITNLVENHKKTNWRWKFNINAIAKSFEKDIVKFPIVRVDFKERTLFIAGGESDYLRPVDESEIKNLFPRAEFVYIPGAGHWVHAEKPQEFLAALMEFLNKEPGIIQS